MAQLFEIKSLQVLDGNSLMNRYYYDTLDDNLTAEEVADAFTVNILPFKLDVQEQNLEHTAVAVRELLEGKDQYVNKFTNAFGDVNSEFVSSFFAWGISLFPASGGFRAGGKRLAGVPENQINDGQAGTSAATALQTLADIMVQEIVFAATQSFLTPVLARQVANGTAYIISPLIQGAFTRLTTQNSRKHYKGGGINTPAAPNKTYAYVSATSSFTGAPLAANYTMQPNSVTWKELTRQVVQ